MNISEAPHVFPEFMQRVYCEVHEWLKTVEGVGSYKGVDPNLDRDDMKNAARHFDRRFPGHFFKLSHALNCLLRAENLLPWLKDDRSFCLVDVGCGAGVASAAFVECLALLRESQGLSDPMTVWCIGVDPSQHALTMYEHVMTALEAAMSPLGIMVRHRLVNEGIPGATRSLEDCLKQIRIDWHKPLLPHLLVFQVNIVRPLQGALMGRQDIWRQLEELGVERSAFQTDEANLYGFQEVLAYQELLMRVPVDHLHLITVATVENATWRALVEKMQFAIDRVLGSYNVVERIMAGEYQVWFINPQCSSYRDLVGGQPVETTFHLDCTNVTADDWQKDEKWQLVIAPDNLILAWARVRAALTRESFLDEVEIRLFERDLENNIAGLQRQLLAYANEVMHHEDGLTYQFPKNEHETRPRIVSRMEEEILSVAIIQQLGKEASGLAASSYAYRLNIGKYGDTEYLYDYWFDSHQNFSTAVREEAQRNMDGTVVTIDLKSYYTRIDQVKLLDRSTEELRTQSERVKWLLGCLLLRDLCPEHHEPGCGLAQGGVASGFFANIFLTPVDVLFGVTNPHHVCIVNPIVKTTDERK